VRRSGTGPHGPIARDVTPAGAKEPGDTAS
jgi:hypothetical protein